MTEHYLAGRMSDRPGSPSYIPVVTHCTCGLAFFSHRGREAADELWHEHVLDVMDSPNPDDD